MQIPLQITFHDMDHSDAVEVKIKEKVAHLEKFCDEIIGCRVAVEAPHEHHHKGKLYHVRINLTVPGDEIVVSREHHMDHAHEDLYVVIRDAFGAAQRQLEDYVRRHRNKVKSHEIPPHGQVIKLVPEEDYGMIETTDGRQVYFHRNSIVDGDFDRLQIGSKVHFVEEAGEQGPQASTVHVDGKHHITG